MIHRNGSQITRAVRRALVLGACAVSGVGTAAAQETAPTETLDTIIVTGSRIRTPNLESVSPVTSVSAEDIVRTGKSSIEDVINELPQVFSAQGSNVSNGSDGTATVNLRGLGSNRTLVLVNGRRLQPGDPNSNFAQDINIIPTALVKRVEILTGGASSVYGADAVAGVVNFILDDKFEGVRLTGGYSFYNHHNDDGASQQLNRDSGFALPKSNVNVGYDKNFSFALGSNFADGRGNATFYATYRETDPVLQSNYDYSACTFNSGDQFSCGGSSTSFPGRFRPINPTTGAPVGNYTLDAAGNFVAGTPSAYNFGPLNYYQRPNQRYTAGAMFSFDVSDKATVYSEFKYMKDQSTSQIAPSGIFIQQYTLSCANPLWNAAQFNAFCGQFGLTSTDDTDVQVRRRNVEGGSRQQDLNHDAYHAVAGVRGEINDAWTYDVYGTHGNSRTSNTYLNDFSIARSGRALDVVLDPTTNQPVCRSVLNGSDTACVPYNIWQAGQVSPAALSYLQTPLLSVGEVTEGIVNASVTGDLGKYGVKFPTASEGLIVNLGAEYRTIDSSFQPDGNYIIGDGAGQGGATLPLSGGYRSMDAFVEARLPILDNLSTEFGYRYSDYSGDLEASANTYKFGVDFSPIDSLRLRGSYQRAVRVPNVSELFSVQQVGLRGTLDPCAGPSPSLTVTECERTGLSPALYGNIDANPAAQYNGFIGGNQNLKPEKADTTSFGFAWQPGFVPGLRMQVDWYKIKIKDPIQNPNSDFTLVGCAVTGAANLCSKVFRDANGSLWETAEGYVVDTLENIGKIESSGIDLDASYDFEVGSYGRMRVGVVGTYLDKFETTPQAGFTYDCVGLFGGICSSGTPNGMPVAEWRHKADVTWSTPWYGLEINLAWRYFGEVKRDLESSQGSLALLGTATGVIPSDSKLGSRSYLDLSGAIEVLKGVTVRVGANNLLDKDPPLVGSSTCPTGPCNGNTYPQAYDALGRQLFMSVNVDF